MRTGPFLEPKDKLGVAGMTATVMRSGGTTTMTGEQINERMDFLAGNVSGDEPVDPHAPPGRGAEDLDGHPHQPGVPRGQAAARARPGAGRDPQPQPEPVDASPARTWTKLIYGEDSPMAAEPTEAGTSGITRDDLAAWHKKYWGANNAILVVVRRLQEGRDAAEARGDVRQVGARPRRPCRRSRRSSRPRRPGVYMVQPQVPSNQGIIQIGHLGLMQDDPDYPAVDLMNYILGGGSFSSRITKVVRTDNGLAYSTSSNFSGGQLYPGTFAAFCQTKNSTVVFASQLMLDLIEGMRAGDVSQADLELAKTARVEAFPATFGSLIADADGLRAARVQQPAAGLLRHAAREVREGDAGRPQARGAEVAAGPTRWSSWWPATSTSARPARTRSLPNQATIDAMAAKFGGRTIDGLAKKYGDGTVHVVTLK